jgi:O-antigen ligase
MAKSAARRQRAKAQEGNGSRGAVPAERQARGAAGGGRTASVRTAPDQRRSSAGAGRAGSAATATAVGERPAQAGRRRAPAEGTRSTPALKRRSRQEERRAPPATARARPGVLAWSATVGAVLLGTLAFTNETFPHFGPRVAVLLVLAALGLPTLMARAWHSPLAWPSRAALGFLGVAALAAALSPSPLLGFFGRDQSGTGAIFWVCVAAVWALGTELRATGSELLAKGLLLVALLNGAATILEVGGLGWSWLAHVVAHLPGLEFGGGQPTGMFGNPVYSAEVMVGGLALLAWRSGSRTGWWWAMTAVLGAATYLSGERYGPLMLLGLVVWVAVVRGRRAGALFAGASLGGLVAGVAVKHAVETISPLALRPVATTSGAFGPRLHEWIASLHAVVAHPLLGIGPAQSSTATLPYLSRAFVVSNGPFPDVHNFVLEVAVTTGLLGLVAFAAWLVPAFRTAGGPLLLYAVVLLVGALIEPLEITITSLAFLALGAAGASALGREPAPARRQAQPSLSFLGIASARAGLVVLALVAGYFVMLGNTELHDGVAQGDPATLMAASRHLPMWSDGPSATSSVLSVGGVQRNSRALLLQAVAWGQVAISRNPTDEGSWTRLAYDDILVGRLKAASAALAHSLETNADDDHIFLDEVSVSVLQGHTARAVQWADQARALFHQAVLSKLARCLQAHEAPSFKANQVIEACFPKGPASSG